MLTILIRTVLIYILLHAMLRLMGKRQLGELQVSEFIVSIMLSEIAVTPILSRTTPVLHSVIPIFVLLSAEVILSHLLMKCNFLKRIFYGSPAILVHNGIIDQAEMRKHRIELDELLSELRQKGFPHIDEVNYVILEENGKMSVFPKAQNSPLTPDSIEKQVPEYGISHLVILDGTVLENNLIRAKWDRKRLDDELTSKKLLLSDVFLMTVDDAERVTTITKEKK